MKKLTQEELLNIDIKHGKRNSSLKQREVIDFLEKLEIKESSLILKEDWGVKTSPAIYLNVSFRRQNSKKQFIVQTLADNTGWVITRKENRE